MDLSGVLVLTNARNWLVYVVSILAVFWLQPAVPVRFLDFWLPCASLAAAVLVWALTAPHEARFSRMVWRDVAVLMLIVIAVAATRYGDVIGLPAFSTLLTRTRPPELTRVLFPLFALLLMIAVIVRARTITARVPAVIVVFGIALLIVSKTETLAALVSQGLRALQGQGTAQATALDWRWLGLSYIVFRLIAAARERAAGRLPGFRLREFVSFVLFAPALQAGPIDRPERFLADLRNPYTPDLTLLLEAGKRLLIGAFKKFAIADTVALIALSDANALTLKPGWAWLPVYAYAVRIFFDFSGYTDIVLGIARLAGVSLAENFNAPYLKPNLTQFWNSWHMSLSNWFRAYWFNPLTRGLRKREWAQTPIILLCQTSTMLLIALWHGVTINFVLWGLWHAAGLFVHNRWAAFARSRLGFVPERPGLQRAVNITGVLLTFHFVALGWVFFALSSPEMALTVLRRLFGVL
jgi:alginate O-acetyltransferase complex protein AlgI